MPKGARTAWQAGEIWGWQVEVVDGIGGAASMAAGAEGVDYMAMAAHGAKMRHGLNVT